MRRDSFISRHLLISISFTLFAVSIIPSYALAAGNIDPAHKYAFSNVGGYINFAPTNSGVTVTDSTVTGYAWSANDGWINFAPANGGVLNDGSGNLSGYAWDSSAGWVNFSGVTINTSTGKFAGMATGGTVSGASFRINFDCTYCDVVTTWRPASGGSGGSGGGGGGGGGGAGCPSGSAWNPSTNSCTVISTTPPTGTTTPPVVTTSPTTPPPTQIGPPTSGVIPPGGSGSIPPSESNNPSQPPPGSATTVPAQVNHNSTNLLATLAIVGVVFAGLAVLYTTNGARFVADIGWSAIAWFGFFGAAKSIRNSEIGVIPTDALYALAAKALDEQAVERVYRVKGKAPTAPHDVLISSVEELEQFGISLSNEQKAMLTKEYWPGPVSVVLPCTAPHLSYLHRNTNTLVFRFPADFVTLGFLRKTGPVLAATANPEGLPQATTVNEARDYFKNEVDFYINRGKLRKSTSSLIAIDESGKVKVLREEKEPSA